MPHRGVHLFGRPLGVIAVMLYKTVWGLAECASGLLLLFSGAIIRIELSEDPQDLFMNWLLKTVHFNPSNALRFGILLILLGLIKFAIAVGVWYGSWNVRRVLMIFLSIITVYACVDIIVSFSAWKFFTLASDLVILFYLWKILPSHLSYDSHHIT